MFHTSKQSESAPTAPKRAEPTARPQTVAVFDIDETLLRTGPVDAEAFARAVASVLDLEQIDTNWSRYPEVTDTAIARVIARERLARDATERELDAMRTATREHLLASARKDQAGFQPVPGALELIAHLRADPSWGVALATGAWRASALAKLESVGLDPGAIPPDPDQGWGGLHTCDDAEHRANIITRAIEHCSANATHNDADAPTRFLYIGDGVWDARAARSLGIGFVARADAPDRLARFEQEGVAHTLPDFTDLQRTLETLTAAAL